MSFSYSRSITVNHLQCGGSNSTNFPMLFNTTDATLKTVGNGGHVQNANGYDIYFYADSGLTTKLDHEIERYNASTGEFIAWIRIPTLTFASDVVIYIAYGDASISSNPSLATTWNSNYLGVYHLKDGSSLNVNDSTGNARNGTNASCTASAGKVDGAAAFNGSAYINLGNVAAFTMSRDFTLEAWANLAAFGAYQSIVSRGNLGWFFAINPSGKLEMIRSQVSIEGTGTTTLSAGTMYHCGFVMTPAGINTGNFYLNGVPDGSYSEGNFLGSGGQDTAIGADTDVANGFFAKPSNGSIIDEVRIINTALSADWMLANYNTMNSPGTFYTLGSENNLGGGPNYILFGQGLM